MTRPHSHFIFRQGCQLCRCLSYWWLIGILIGLMPFSFAKNVGNFMLCEMLKIILRKLRFNPARSDWTLKNLENWMNFSSFPMFISIWGENDLFFKIFFGRQESFLWGHWYPYFGLLVTSPLGFKARVGSALFKLSGGIPLHIPWDSPLVQHLLTSWQPAWQPSRLFHIPARHWWDSKPGAIRKRSF